MSEELKPCPICGDTPLRNGRGHVGGVLCSGIGAPPNMAHLVQTYGADQAEADAAWNTRALTLDREAIALAQEYAAKRDWSGAYYALRALVPDNDFSEAKP